MIMVVVIKHWVKIQESQELDKITDQIANGEMPHIKETLKELFKRAALTRSPADLFDLPIHGAE